MRIAGFILLLLIVSQVCPMAYAQLVPTNKPARVILSWDPNPEVDIAGYKIYHGTDSRVYNTVVDLPCVLTNGITEVHTTNAVLSNFLRGVTYYFAATAYNTIPLESDFSDEVSVTIPDLPITPKGLRVTNQLSVVCVTVTLESANDPLGEWDEVISQHHTTEPTEPTFYRSMLSVKLLP